MYKLTSQYISKNTTNSKHMAHNKGPKQWHMQGKSHVCSPSLQ